MKKILSLLLVVIMIACAMPVFGATDTYEATNAVKVLNALDILVGDEQGNLNLNNRITRAEFATLMTRVLDVDTKAFTKETFSDVPTTHWGYNAIMNCYTLGIIKGCGDGTFKPSAYVSYDEAVKMTMCALGYELYAQSKGGWPTGYLVAANQMKVTEGVGADATRGDIAQLLYNALSTPKMEQTTYGTKEEFSILNGKNGKEYRTLLTDMDIYIATGVVGEKNVDEIEIIISTDSEDEEFEDGDVVTFNINNTDVYDYQHQAVEVYAKKNSKRDYDILCVVPSIEGESLTIYSDDIKDVDGNKVEYYVNGNKTKTIKLDENVVYDYNKTGKKGDKELIDLEDCIVTFVEHNGDNAYDRIVISHYISTKIEEVHYSKDKMTLVEGNLGFDFDDEDVTIVFVDEKGNTIDFYDFEENDVIAVLSDVDRVQKYDNYIKIVKLTNSTVYGEIEEIFTRDGKKYFVIDGNEYTNNSTISLKIGDEGTFYIGMTDCIVDFEGTTSAVDYGYILEVEKSRESFSKDLWQVKLLTYNGVKIYDLTETASNNADDLFANLNDENRVVNYKVNSQGKIRNIEVAGTPIAFEGSYREDAQMLAGKPIEDNAIIFNVCDEDADDAFASDISYLVDESEYKGYVMRDEDGYSVVILTEGKGQFEDENGFAIITKISASKDEEDNDMLKVSIVENEEEKVIYITEDSDTDYAELAASTQIGTVIAYNATANNIVTEYVIIAEMIGGELVVDEDAATKEFSKDTEFVYGYISNTSRTKVSKGEVIEISDDTTVVVTSVTNKYTYDCTGRNTKIVIGDFLAEDAYYYDEEIGEATLVFVKIVDDELVDIYTFTGRVTIE